MPERPRVLVVTTNFPIRVRGDVTGNFVYDPIIALQDEVDFTVLAPLDASEAPRQEPLAPGVEVRRFQYFWPRSAQRLAYGYGIPENLQTDRSSWLQLPFLCLQFILWTLRLARTVDVIHCHWLLTVPLALPGARFHGKPVVATLHGTDINDVPRWILRLLLPRCDLLVSSHDDLLETVRRLAPDVPTRRIRHLIEPQSVDDEGVVALRRHVPEGAPLVVFVGRLSPVRDPLTLVKATPRLLEKVPDARVAILGEGPQRPALESEIERLDVRDHVVLLGHRPDVWTFLRHADVFTALSPLNNVWVTALAEAMTAGVPAVVTASGATPATLTDGHDALLVPTGEPEPLADALARVLTDRGLGERLAVNAGHTLAEAGFDPAHVRAQTLDTYRELAARVR